MDQLFFLSYYLTGKALDFYEQVVIRKPAIYSLEDFFLDLFDFCFPADFRNKMRDQLNRCFAAFEQLWRVVGLPNDQEKVVRFWRSLRPDIQQELYRKDLDAEISSWDEVVLAAERAEVWLKLDASRASHGVTWRQFHFALPTRSIGDLYAFNAELALEMGQPYPGDDTEPVENERRFCLYRVSDTQYIVMDSTTGLDYLIDDENLQNPGFMLGLWYACERQKAIGLDPRVVPMEDRYLAELGNALIIGARTMLEHAVWDGIDKNAEFSRFHVQDKDYETLTVMDLTEEI
ncbi:hypothetical protein B0H13DRAFT_2340552 [Mycena leptocephala]|nr:hypothetical protein B0H13DRAFT_2340552 [Mycena leptocephala]